MPKLTGPKYSDGSQAGIVIEQTPNPVLNSCTTAWRSPCHQAFFPCAGLIPLVWRRSRMACSCVRGKEKLSLLSLTNRIHIP